MEAALEILFVIILPILGIMVVIWFWQVSKLFAYLKNKYPEEYVAMGEPTLFMNNAAKNNIALIGFIQGSRPSQLGDDHLSTWCRFLTRFFYVYVCLFGCLFISIILSAYFSSSS